MSEEEDGRGDDKGVIKENQIFNSLGGSGEGVEEVDRGVLEAPPKGILKPQPHREEGEELQVSKEIPSEEKSKKG